MDDPEPDIQIFPRPNGSLSGLPLNLLWEVTRRHGYYVGLWELARSGETVSEQHAAYRQCARDLLRLIGVTGEPVSPAMSAAELDPEQLLAGFLAGAVLPLTYRQILRDFVFGLDGAERELLGRVLLGCADRNREIPEDESYLNEIAGDTRLAFLDRHTPGLKFSIDLSAPTRAIMEGVRAAVQAAKKQSPQRETRRRPDRILDYLKVWDLREGWDNGTYDGSREKTLKQISRLLKRPMQTVVSQYRSAFQAITGRPFSPKVWFRLFGVLKLSATFNEGFGQRSWNRFLLLINEPADVIAESEPHQFDSDKGIFELQESIRMLLKQGHTDNEIVKRLALKNDKLVSYYRSRAADEL